MDQHYQNSSHLGRFASKQQYSEKLKHPLWQKKRLEILEAANWRCSACGVEDKTLHVHHLRYAGDNPWDTPNELLECLCETCHSRREEANRALSEMMREASTTEFDLFCMYVAWASRLFDTAPPDIQERGAANFVLRTFNIAVKAAFAKGDSAPNDEDSRKEAA